MFSELFADLDMQLLTASDDTMRWTALTAGTREVLGRFDHLTAPKTICTTGATVIEQLAKCVRQFAIHGAPDMASWLQDVVDLLATHHELQLLCADQTRRSMGAST